VQESLCFKGFPALFRGHFLVFGVFMVLATDDNARKSRAI
jgi:hypothetical protein